MSEPERHIEKLLRAYAKRQREQSESPLEMHPATRRMLQSEVARQAGKAVREAPAETGFRANIFAGLWPRVAFAASVLLVVGVSVWLLLPALHERKQMDLAQAGPEFRLDTPTAPGPLATPAPIIGRDQADAAGKAWLWSASPQPAEGVRSGELADHLAALAPLREEAQKPGAQMAEGKATGVLSFAGEGLESGRIQGGVPGGLAMSAPSQPEAGAFAQRYGVGLDAAQEFDKGLSFRGSGVGSAPAAPAEHFFGEVQAHQLTEDLGKVELALKPPETPAAAPPPSQAPALTVPVIETQGEHLALAGSDTVAERLERPASLAAQTASARRQNFSRVDLQSQLAVADEFADARTVLASFQIEQIGNQVRIVDRDGSIYSGELQTADVGRREFRTRAVSPAPGAPAVKDKAESRARAATEVATRAAGEQLGKEQEAAGARATGAAAGTLPRLRQTYSFVVEGTNRSLGQKIVFSGHVWSADPAAPTITDAVRGVVVDSAATPAGPAMLPLVNGRITGQVLLGDQSIEIHAAPTTQP